MVSNEASSDLPLHLKYTFGSQKFLFFENNGKFKIFATEKNFEYLKNS
jgi:hypothetical protein